MLYSKTKIALQGRGRIHTRSSRREGAWNGRPLWIWRRPIRWPIPFSLWTFDLCYAVSSPSFCCFVELTNQRWYQNLGFFFGNLYLRSSPNQFLESWSFCSLFLLLCHRRKEEEIGGYEMLMLKCLRGLWRWARRHQRWIGERCMEPPIGSGAAHIGYHLTNWAKLAQKSPLFYFQNLKPLNKNNAAIWKYGTSAA